MIYTLQVERPARRSLAQLPNRDYRRVTAALAALRDTPRPPGCVKLTGSDLWRIRVGDYRVIYEIDDAAQVVTVIDVGHRRDVYR